FMKNMGSFGGLAKMIPGMNKISGDQLEQAELQLKRCEAMIGSMTIEERKNPELLSSSPSRRKRIAKGSGRDLKDVSKLVSDFQKMRSLMQQMGQGNFGMPGMGGLGDMFGGGMPGMGGGMPGMGGGMPGMGGGMRPGWRGYETPGKKKKKGKKKKGFGTL
ncbi:MAG: signal recognition particle protein, partial [Merismopedia sp. SIO2A8]|nr:signal recognition particle protein [Merismopedia sp. SIO2A8]